MSPTYILITAVALSSLFIPSQSVELTFPSTVSGKTIFCTSTPMTWVNAEIDCVNRGGHLATIADAAEDALVKTACSTLTSTGLHIGYTDAAVDTQWVWVDGSTSSYTGWDSGEPTPVDNGEDCAHYWVAAGPLAGWYDGLGNPNACTTNPNNFGYVCERCTSGGTVPDCFGSSTIQPE